MSPSPAGKGTRTPKKTGNDKGNTPAKPDKRGPLVDRELSDLMGSPGKRQRRENTNPCKISTTSTLKSPEKRLWSVPTGRLSPPFSLVPKPMNPLSANSLASQLRKAKQSTMTNYVASISDREVADIDEELANIQEELLESPGTNRSDSPAMSEGSDSSLFKTPRDKSAYRALSFSPSTASGFRQMHSLIGDLKREIQTQLGTMERSLTRILTCVLPPLETNIAEDIPRLPLTDKDGEKQLNELLGNKDDFNKVVTFLHGLGGTNPREAVYAVMKTIFTDVFASSKSMKGIRRSGKPPKDAFLGTALFKAVMCAVRRRFKTATVSEVIELTANWLKDAPSREKKRQKRHENREKILRDYEEDDDDTERSSS